MLLPTQCVATPLRYLNQGSVFASPTPAPPPIGGGVFDGITWTLSNYDTSGRWTDWERDLVATDDVTVVTSTGAVIADVVSIVAGAETTVITVNVQSTAGSLDDGQVTGVWKMTAV